MEDEDKRKDEGQPEEAAGGELHEEELPPWEVPADESGDPAEAPDSLDDGGVETEGTLEVPAAGLPEPDADGAPAETPDDPKTLDVAGVDEPEPDQAPPDPEPAQAPPEPEPDQVPAEPEPDQAPPEPDPRAAYDYYGVPEAERPEGLVPAQAAPAEQPGPAQGDGELRFSQDEADRPGKSYWEIVSDQFRQNRLAVWSMRILFILFLLAVYAPLISLNVPFVYKDDLRSTLSEGDLVEIGACGYKVERKTVPVPLKDDKGVTTTVKRNVFHLIPPAGKAIPIQGDVVLGRDGQRPP